MLRLFILFLCLLMLSCYKADVVQSQTANTDPATFAKEITSLLEKSEEAVKS